ncbi:MAG: CopD family protein [Candidatus Binataceae bacterium]
MILFGTVIALHLFGAIMWIGGLLALASILGRVGEEVGLPRERLLGAVRTTYKSAVNIGAAITIVLGIILILMQPEVMRQGWLHTKLLLIAIILFYQWRLYRRIRQLEENPSQSSGGEFRMAHGIVSLLVLAILLLAMLKPF